ncbi:MAG: hypothetical protein E6H08_15895 [Bacteroidetes bacterium]|nr:MAG: hypothetical protein E6H08_15895 [Bacteroidota bacterium]
MKKTSLFLLISAFIIFVFNQSASAQETKKEEKFRKNTVHINLTNPLIFGSGSIVIGYERILKSKKHSFTINFGLTSFPDFGFIDNDSLKHLNKLKDQKGFNVSADYRFYLAKENKYPAPRGVYIGPYYSYNYFGNHNSWEVKTASGVSPVQSEMKLNVHTIGFELGYQFIFGDRISLDMVLLGPGVGAYNFRVAFSNNLSDAAKQKILEALNGGLAEKFPGYGIIVNEEEFKRTGATNRTTIGYRYMVQLGFRF